ncbi:MAG: hypothetical protein R2762_11760 [Bryobacteraceae bacterium]
MAPSAISPACPFANYATTLKLDSSRNRIPVACPNPHGIFTYSLTATNGLIQLFAEQASAGFPAMARRPARPSSHSPAWSTPTAKATSTFAADWGNNRIRKIDAQGIVSTIAGNGQALDTRTAPSPAPAASPLGPLSSIHVDAAGNLYLSEGPFVRRMAAGGNRPRNHRGPRRGDLDYGPTCRRIGRASLFPKLHQVQSRHFHFCRG